MVFTVRGSQSRHRMVDHREALPFPATIGLGRADTNPPCTSRRRYTVENHPERGRHRRDKKPGREPARSDRSNRLDVAELVVLGVRLIQILIDALNG
jgi:hypothetical protein